MKVIIAERGALDAPPGPGIGTMVSQDADDVAITGGAIEGVAIKAASLNVAGFPTSPAGLVAGDVWINGTFLVMVE